MIGQIAKLIEAIPAVFIGATSSSKSEQADKALREYYSNSSSNIQTETDNKSIDELLQEVKENNKKILPQSVEFGLCNLDEELDYYEIYDILESNKISNKSFDAKKYQQAINFLNSDNILDYEPGIWAEHRSFEEYNSDIEKVSGILLEKAQELGIDTSDITFKEYTEKDGESYNDSGVTYYPSGAIVYQNQYQLDELYSRCRDAILVNENAKFKETIYYNNREELVEATKARYEELNGQTKPIENTGINFGNGKIDDISTQLIGNCWVQSPLNAIASSEEGNLILCSNIYRDDELGITTIHLQEAENRGYGYNGKGIYTITDKEIALGQQNLSSGDSDMTAYNLAIQKYFIESGERIDLDGGFPERIFEIVSGAEKGCQDLQVNGVGSFGQTNYFDVLSMTKNGTGATTIIIDKTQKTNIEDVVHGIGHALSVVGATEDGKLLIQESTNSGLYLSDLPVYSGETYNGAQTYIMDEETYHERVIRADHMYWGA